jgi:hypothetical protein
VLKTLHAKPIRDDIYWLIRQVNRLGNTERLRNVSGAFTKDAGAVIGPFIPIRRSQTFQGAVEMPVASHLFYSIPSGLTFFKRLYLTYTRLADGICGFRVVQRRQRTISELFTRLYYNKFDKCLQIVSDQFEIGITTQVKAPFTQ